MKGPVAPPSIRATVGYRLNRAGTEVIEVSMVARNGDDIVWRESIDANLPLVGIHDSMSNHTQTTSAVRGRKNPSVRMKPKQEAKEARPTAKKKH